MEKMKVMKEKRKIKQELNRVRSLGQTQKLYFGVQLPLYSAFQII